MEIDLGSGNTQDMHEFNDELASQLTVPVYGAIGALSISPLPVIPRIANISSLKVTSTV